MLNIKDLSASTELDHKALTEMRGGSNFAYIGEQHVHDGDGISIGSPNTVYKGDVVFQDDRDTLLNVLSPFAYTTAF